MKSILTKIRLALALSLAFILSTCVEDHVLPNFGTIYLTSDPIGATIYLNGENTGKVTPDSLVELLSDNYGIALSMSEFFDTTFSADVNEGQILNYDIFLEEENPKGEIVLSSEPSGADIFINNINTGEVTPASFSNLERGSYQVKLMLNLYDDSNFTIQLDKDEKVEKNTRMIIAGTAGSLFISSTPAGAKIFLDNFDTKLVTPDTVKPLSAGLYTIKLSLENYRDTTIISNVQSSSLTSENVILTYFEPRGSISLDSNPKGAKIYLNESDTELLTPNVVRKLEAGDYEIRLSLTQYFDTTFTIPVVEDQRTNWPLVELIEIPFLIEVVINPEGAGNVSGDGGYYSGDDVILMASANTGYTFVNWTESGAEVSTNPTIQFTAERNRNLVANFSLNSYLIATSSNPEDGGNTSGDGTYNHGSTANISSVPSSGYSFINWTEDGSPVHNESNYSFTVTRARDLVANFSINNYVITTSSNPDEGGTTSGGGGFDFGDDVTVSATPSEGYTFVNWTEGGSEVSLDQNYTFTVSGNRDLVANFLKNTYNVSTSSSPAEGGSTSGSGLYNHGETVTLTATPAQGYSFVNWTENTSEVSDDSEFSFTIESNRNFVANFIKNGSIAINSDPEGANIFLNNNFIGEQTPFTIEDLIPGQYNITLRLADFADTTVSAEVFPGETNDLGTVFLLDITPDVEVEISYSVNTITGRLEFSFLFNQTIFLSRIGITTPNNDFFLIPFNATYLEGIPVNWGYPEKIVGEWRFNFIGNKVGGRQDNFNFEETENVQ